jgi:uncharacterized protein with GYD domain
MITRKRSDYFSQLDDEIKELVAEQPDVFKKHLPVYGHYDVIVPVEHTDLHGIHRAVTVLQAKCRGSLDSTSTFVAAGPAFDNEHRYKNGRQVCVGIVTDLGKQDSVRKRLESLKDFDLADVVFGEFDVIALFTATQETPSAVLRNAIKEIPEIRKTTTMLPSALTTI